jgi:hypothetical protein
LEASTVPTRCHSVVTATFQKFANLSYAAARKPHKSRRSCHVSLDMLSCSRAPVRVSRIHPQPVRRILARARPASPNARPTPIAPASASMVIAWNVPSMRIASIPNRYASETSVRVARYRANVPTPRQFARPIHASHARTTCNARNSALTSAWIRRHQTRARAAAASRTPTARQRTPNASPCSVPLRARLTRGKGSSRSHSETTSVVA